MQPATRYNPQTGQYEMGHVDPTGNWVPTLPRSGGGQAVLTAGPTTVLPSPRGMQGVTPQPVVAQPVAAAPPVQPTPTITDDMMLQEFMYAPAQPGQSTVAAQPPGYIPPPKPVFPTQRVPSWVNEVARSRDAAERTKVQSQSAPTPEKK